MRRVDKRGSDPLRSRVRWRWRRLKLQACFSTDNPLHFIHPLLLRCVSGQRSCAAQCSRCADGRSYFFIRVRVIKAWCLVNQYGKTRKPILAQPQLKSSSVETETQPSRILVKEV